jgi:hypothetical protein
MKQRIELFEFFIDKVPIQSVEYLESSQILTNFSVHFTSSSLGSKELSSQNEENNNNEHRRRESLVSTITTSNKYKEMFLNIQKDQKKRNKRISFAFQK